MRNVSAFQPKESGYSIFGSALLSYLKLDDTSGNPIDSFNNSNSWVNNNSVSYGTGKLNGAADFGITGTTKKINTTSTLSNIGAGNFSCNMWVNFSALPSSGSQECIFSIQVNGTKNQHEFDYRNVAGTYRWNVWTGSNGGTESGFDITESTGTWYMMTLTYDGSNLRLYRNGSLIITKVTGTIATAQNVLTLGNRYTDSRQLYGLLDEFSLYNRVITSDEISFLYNSGNAKFFTYGRTAAYYPLNKVQCNPELSSTSLFSDANLVSYWKFEGNSNDSKSTNNGTDTAITYSAANGKFNQGAGFNGSTSVIITGSNANLSLNTVTLCAWFRSTTTGTQRRIIANAKTSNGGNFDITLVSDGNLKITIYRSSPFLAYDLLTTGKNYDDGNWHFMVAVYSGGSVTGYIDGVQVSSGSTSAITVGNIVTIGDLGLNGSIDDASVFSRALSANEISNLYLSKLAIDYSGNANNGTETDILYIQGIFGQGAKFNNSSSNITFLTVPATGANPFTASLWFKTTNAGALEAMIHWGSAVSNQGFDLYISNTNKLTTNFYGGGGVVSTTQSVNNGQWHHGLATYDGTNIRLYCDGILVGTGSNVTANIGTNYKNIGKDSGGGNFFGGTMDEIILESRVWSSKEVETYYRKSLLNYKPQKIGFFQQISNMFMFFFSK